MLDPWIIEEILRREDERRRDQERSRIEIPVDRPPPQYQDTPTPAGEKDRGVVIIDI
jgi:hypothetical protein